MWTKKRFLAAAGVTVGGLLTVFAGAAWAPPGDTQTATFSRVSLTLDGVETATFTRCLGLGTKTNVIAQQIAGPDGEPRESLQAGATSVGKIVCERGVSSDNTIGAWRDLVSSGDMSGARKNGSFVLYNATGAAAVRWNAVNMWPSEHTYHFESSTGREVVTFVAESLTRVAP